MTDAERDVLAKFRLGSHITHADTCATITTQVELQQYRIGLQQRGALTSEAMGAIERRRAMLQRDLGVRGR